MLTARAKFELAAAAIALLAITVAASSWLGAREDGIRLAATIAAQKSVIDGAQKEMAAHQEADKQRDAQTAATLQVMAQSVSKAQTPAQITNWIPAQPGFDALKSLAIAAATPQNPQPNATASIPEAQLAALRDTISQCEICAVKLSTAQADLTSRDDQLKLAGEQLSATQKERDAAITAARGGGFWSRVKRSAKWFAIGAGFGAAALCGSGHCK